jgi:predicted nucleic acid-binding protein
MMDVSLDTDIVIHLYKANMKELLFHYFDNLYIHEYLLENEVRNKSTDVYNQVCCDISEGKITVVNNAYLSNIGMQKTFDALVWDYKNLFDFGEVNAVALASTLGIAALVSDDTKDYGPHDTLVKEAIEDVIPFAFYELLFLQYLESDDDYDTFLNSFQKVNCISFSKPMGFVSRIKRVVKRFSSNGSKRDYSWMIEFCKSRNIDYNHKMRCLLANLKHE